MAPNDLRFCCEALLRPPPIQVKKIPGGGRSAWGLGSSKRWLERSLDFTKCNDTTPGAV
jgi:hypothetical protein